MKLAGILLAVFAAMVAGQNSSAASQTTPMAIQATEQSSSIHGVVVNAKTGQPLGRALVQVEGSSLLTGPDGVFSFSGVNGTATTLRVKKPGFYMGLDPYETGMKQVPVGSAEEVRVVLYPEAVITGTVRAVDGEPLTGLQVQALRLIDEEAGRRWTMAGQTATNGDGEFRLALPGGEYVVETQYMPDRTGGRGAVLPVMVPAAGSNGGSGGGLSTLRVMSGSEQRLDLHPTVRQSHAVHLLIDSSAGAGVEQFSPQIQAHLANGLVFSPGQTRGTARHGEVVVNLPNGSYLLSASTGLRDDDASYGETRVTVADEDVSGVTIHLQKALELTVEASIDPVATGSTGTGSAPEVDPDSASFVQQLGIFMERTDTGVSLRTENVLAATPRGGPVAFSLLPGVYRLRSQGYSQWYVESAAAGGTDLLTQDLVVDGGSSSVPLRLVVSNQTATIKGTTKLGGMAAGCYVSLIATMPSAAPVIHAKSAEDGLFAHGLVPPGSYRAVASEMQLNLDMTDPVVQKQLAPYMKTITVDAGGTESLDLDAIPATEMTP